MTKRSLIAVLGLALYFQARGDPPHQSARKVENLTAAWYYSEDNVTITVEDDEDKKHWMYVYVKDWRNMTIIYEKIRCRSEKSPKKNETRRRQCVNSTSLVIRNATTLDSGYYYRVKTPRNGSGLYSDLEEDEHFKFGETQLFALVVYPETRAEITRQKAIAELNNKMKEWAEYARYMLRFSPSLP